MVDMIKSVEIFNHLMNGRMINREQMASYGEFEPDPLFAEIMGNLDDYRKQYAMCGYNLIDTGSFLYIVRDYEYENNKSMIAMKAYCLLLIIGKYTTAHGRRLDNLGVASGGLAQADIVKIQEAANTKEILQRIGFADGDDFSGCIRTILVERCIAYIHPVSQNLILASAGLRFFEDITNNFSLDDDDSSFSATDEDAVDVKVYEDIG